MERVKKTQVERRLESDKRIIRSAIRNFGNYGYTQSTFTLIAKDAGLTQGLLVQRYETKENLLFEAYRYIINEYFAQREDCDVLTYFLILLINDIKHLRTIDIEAFNFLKMELNSFDIPKEFNKKKKELLLARKLGQLIIEAQNKEIVPKDTTLNLIDAFASQVFNQIAMSDKYGIPCPEDSFFLRILNFSDDELQKREKQKELMLDSIINTFDAIAYVYLKENKVEPLLVRSTMANFEAKDDARKSYYTIIETQIDKSDHFKMKELLDFDTLSDRLKNKNIIFEKCKTVDNQKLSVSIIPVKNDIEERVIEVLIGVQGE